MQEQINIKNHMSKIALNCKMKVYLEKFTTSKEAIHYFYDLLDLQNDSDEYHNRVSKFRYPEQVICSESNFKEFLKTAIERILDAGFLCENIICNPKNREVLEDAISGNFKSEDVENVLYSEDFEIYETENCPEGNIIVYSGFDKNNISTDLDYGDIGSVEIFNFSSEEQSVRKNKNLLDNRIFMKILGYS